MKKLYTLLLIAISSASFAQEFTAATYTFDGVTNATGLTDPTPVPTAPGVTFGSFTAVNAVATNSTASFRFSFDNQPLGATVSSDTYTDHTGSLDGNTYFQVTVTPVSGNSLTLTKIGFRMQRSGTGVRTYSVRSSADGYAANLPASIDPVNAELSVEAGNIFYRTHDAITTGQNGSTITLSGAAYTAITTPITFRFYGWNAEGTGGTFSIDDVAFTGSTASLGVDQNAIAGLKVYPNPVTNGTLFIDTLANSDKKVAIYDVLGKQVINTTISGNSVNVANLNNGVYIVKVTEEGKTATRKLVIR